MFNIVLVEPEIPQNTGNISRTCACTGAALHIVKPMGFEITDAKLKRAGLDYWDKLNLTYYENLRAQRGRAVILPVEKGEQALHGRGVPRRRFSRVRQGDQGLARARRFRQPRHRAAHTHGGGLALAQPIEHRGFGAVRGVAANGVRGVVLARNE